MNVGCVLLCKLGVLWHVDILLGHPHSFLKKEFINGNLVLSRYQPHLGPGLESQDKLLNLRLYNENSVCILGPEGTAGGGPSLFSSPYRAIPRNTYEEPNSLKRLTYLERRMFS